MPMPMPPLPSPILPTTLPMLPQPFRKLKTVQPHQSVLKYPSISRMALSLLIKSRDCPNLPEQIPPLQLPTATRPLSEATAPTGHATWYNVAIPTSTSGQSEWSAARRSESVCENVTTTLVAMHFPSCLQVMRRTAISTTTTRCPWANRTICSTVVHMWLPRTTA